jgi:hypothetical protein
VAKNKGKFPSQLHMYRMCRGVDFVSMVSRCEQQSRALGLVDFSFPRRVFDVIEDLSLQSSIHLYVRRYIRRTFVGLTLEYNVVNRTKNDPASHDNTRIVHILGRHWLI